MANIFKNQVLLIGNLTDVPEIKTLGNGSSKVTLRLATNEEEVWTDKEGNRRSKETVEYHQVTSFVPHIVKFASYLRKGEKVWVEGKNTTRKYEQDGQTKYIHEVEAKSLESMSLKPKDQAAA